jgi:hypothetical protein
MSHVLMVTGAVALMLAGAVAVVTGSTSVASVAAIAAGIALTIVDLHHEHAH